MKKATFIVAMATAVVMLTGCTAKTPGKVQQDAEQFNSDTIIAQKETIDQQEKVIEDLNNQIEVLKAAGQNTAEESETIAVVETSATVETAEAAEAVKVPLIPKDQEHIQVSALYHDKEIELYAATEENRKNSINNAEVITVKDENGKDVKDRNISIIINGVSVNKVYVVDEGFKEVEELSYDSVDNTYLAQYHMPGGGQYIFLIQTTNGTHYYVTVVY